MTNTELYVCGAAILICLIATVFACHTKYCARKRMEQKAMTILETKNLKKVYGSGKSTLLHMLGGLDRPTAGEVIVDGKPIFTLKDEELTIFRRRKIGFVFQNYNLVPVMSVYENIVLPNMSNHTGSWTLNVFLNSSLHIEDDMVQILENHGYQNENPNAENYIGIGVNWGYTGAQMAAARQYLRRPSGAIGHISINEDIHEMR